MEQDTATNQALTNEVQTAPKQSSFLITFLSILLLISCLIAGFFAYQTQSLVKELTVYKLQQEETPAATASPDPTADWETYTNTKYGYEIKYPNIWRADSLSQGTMGTGSVESTGVDDFLQISLSGQLIPSLNINIETIITSLEKEIEKKIKIMNTSHNPDYKNIKQYEKELNGTKVLVLESDRGDFHTKTNYFSSLNNKYFILVEQIDNTDVEYKETLDQILSTFKFIEPVASSSPVACTMEAKICPDGSAVGRSGPNCDFDPCPGQN